LAFGIIPAIFICVTDCKRKKPIAVGNAVSSIIEESLDITRVSETYARGHSEFNLAGR